jgi:hypothetical protein
MPNLLVAGNSTNGGTAISTDTSGALNIVTGSGSGANAISIDTSQNVGIGTASPTVKLQIEGDVRLGGGKSITATPAGTYTAGSSGYLFSFNSDGNLYQDNYQGAFIWRGASFAERMRIDSSGNLLVGTTSPIQSGVFSVLGSASTAGFRTTATAGSGLVLDVSRTSATGDMVFFRTSSTTLAGFITCPTGTTTSYASVSDYRLKENVQPMIGALAKVAQLKPCTYIWKHDNSDGQGFIAHELQAIVPDAVVGEKDAVNEDGSIKPQAIDTSFLVATLTAAIQEQQVMIQELKAELDALKAKVGE